MEPRLFAGIGLRRKRAPAPRGFALFVGLGVVGAIAASTWRWTHPPERVHAVRVDLLVTPAEDAREEAASWEARRAAAEVTPAAVIPAAGLPAAGTAR